MRKYLPIIPVIIISLVVIFFVSFSIVRGVTKLSVPQGGTGVGTFTSGEVLVGNATSSIQATTSLAKLTITDIFLIGTTSTTSADTVFEVEGDSFFGGHIDLTHTAVEADDHALELDCDAAGFGDVKCIDIVYVTGAITTGDDEEAILVNVNQFAATGGHFVALEVVATEGGLDDIFAVECGALVGCIFQLSGTFGDMGSFSTNSVDALGHATSTSLDTTMFVADNDTVIIGDAAKFQEIEFILDTDASGAGIKPTFEFSTGSAGWVSFTPTDGTNGMRNTGVIIWDDDSVPTWATGTSSLFYIRITRTQNSITTTPVEDKVQITAVTEYQWDLSGDLNVRNVTSSSLSLGGDYITGFVGDGLALSSNTLIFDCSDVISTGLSCSGENLTVDLGTAIDAGEITAAAIDGDDINSNIAGRSLTLTSASPDTLDVDAELYTGSASVNITNPAVYTNGWAQWKPSVAITLTRISCSTDVGTADIQLDERAEATSTTSGTDVFNAVLVCDTDTQATTSFNNAGIAADAPLSVDIDATSSSPTVVRIHLDYTIDD